MTGWINPNGNYEGACVFATGPNEFSASGSCVSANQKVLGSGSVVRAITAADVPSGVYWEGSGSPLSSVNAEDQNTQGSQQEQTSNGSQDQADSAVNAGLPDLEGVMDWMQDEMIEGVPNWGIVAVAALFVFRDKIL